METPNSDNSVKAGTQSIQTILGKSTSPSASGATPDATSTSSSISITKPIATDVEKEVISPNAALMQLAQSLPPSSTIQIPTGSMVSLFSSLAGLQTQVNNFQHQMALQTTSLEKLSKQNEKMQLNAAIKDGAEFAWFPNLPHEIRAMVWQFAHFIPEVATIDVISLDHWPAPVATLAPRLREVCRESRTVALRTHVPRETLDKGLDFGSVRINSAVDILWFTNSNDCLTYGILDFMFEYYDQGLYVPTIAFRALEYFLWMEEADSGYTLSAVFGFMTISRYKAEKVILVVGGEEFFKAKDIIFVEPKASPYEVLGEKILRERHPVSPKSEATKFRELTWKDMENDVMDEIPFLQEVSDDGLEDSYEDWKIIKRIRFMEATTITELRRLKSLKNES